MGYKGKKLENFQLPKTNNVSYIFIYIMSHGEYAPQGYTQGYGGQMPVQPFWEEPKKGEIKGFISNLMAKRKK
jgi:hypothetical protein